MSTSETNEPDLWERVERWISIIGCLCGIAAIVIGSLGYAQANRAAELSEATERRLIEWPEQENQQSVTFRVTGVQDFNFPDPEPSQPGPKPPETVFTVEVTNSGNVALNDVWLVLPEHANRKAPTNFQMKHHVVRTWGKRPGLWLMSIPAGQTVSEEIRLPLAQNPDGSYTAFTNYEGMTLIFTPASGEQRWGTNAGGSSTAIDPTSPLAGAGEQFYMELTIRSGTGGDEEETC